MIKNFILVVAVTVVAVHAATIFKMDELDKSLEHYDKRVPPNTNKETPVEVSMYITRMYGFDDTDKNFNIDLYFRQKWIDERLKFTAANESDMIRAGHELADHIWKPDTFFSSSHRDSLNIQTVPNVFTMIKPNGEVFISGRYSANVPCKKNKDKDGQLECALTIESYGYTVDDINYSWKQDDNQDSVPYGLGKYKLVSIVKKDETASLKTGVYKILKALITIEKK